MSEAARSRLYRTQRTPRWSSATAQADTGPDGYVQVVVDATVEPPAASEESDDETFDPNDPNQPVEALCLTGWVGRGERVMTVSTPDGAMFVVGSMGGGPDLIGHSYIEGGTANDTSNNATGTEVTVDDLDAVAVVVHPHHSVAVKVSLGIGATTGGSSAFVNVYRVEVDSAEAEAETLVGRIFTDDVRANASAGQTINGEAMDLPEPGVYTYRVKVQVNGGWTLRTDLTTDPLYAAWVKVLDEGPTSAAWPSA